MGLDGTLKEFGERAAGQGCILENTTGSKNPVRETKQQQKGTKQEYTVL